MPARAPGQSFPEYQEMVRTPLLAAMLVQMLLRQSGDASVGQVEAEGAAQAPSRASGGGEGCGPEPE